MVSAAAVAHCPACNARLTIAAAQSSGQTAAGDRLPARPRQIGEAWGAQVSITDSAGLKVGDLVDLTVTSKSGKSWPDRMRVVELSKWGANCLRLDDVLGHGDERPRTHGSPSHGHAPRSLPPEGEEPF